MELHIDEFFWTFTFGYILGMAVMFSFMQARKAYLNRIAWENANE